MTQFKIKLLTSILKTQQNIGVSNFLETPISEFYSQLSETKMESSIKNQQNTNMCWAFAGTATLSLLISALHTVQYTTLS